MPRERALGKNKSDDVSNQKIGMVFSAQTAGNFDDNFDDAMKRADVAGTTCFLDGFLAAPDIADLRLQAAKPKTKKRGKKNDGTEDDEEKAQTKKREQMTRRTGLKARIGSMKSKTVKLRGGSAQT